jgi:predicted metal-dependent hydrolase
LQPQSYITACGKTVLIQRKLFLKKLTLRFSKKQKAFVVSAPSLLSFAKITNFIDSAHAWFAKIEAHQPKAPHVIVPGDSISVLGKVVRVDFIQSPKSMVVMKDNVLEVHGIQSKFAQILIKYLKDLAFEKFSHYSHEYAAVLGVKINQIVIKDMKTRFGSCSSFGNLNYCWRVILAPEPVLAYLCAHEVSHLKEMNHSKKFWGHVEQLCPDYKNLQKWLKQHSKELFVHF